MNIPDNWLDILLRLVTATLMASLIGLDREIRDKPAGLRTHMLVGLGAAAFSVFSLEVVDRYSHLEGSIALDPIRIIAGVIGGLGFLGAGSIIQSHGNTHGMTTAAGIWIAGAIGVGCGTGSYFSVTVVTIIALICLNPVRKLERKLGTRRHQNDALRPDSLDAE